MSPARPRVHVAQRIDAEAIEVLRSDFDVTLGYGSEAVDLRTVIPGVDVLVVRNMDLDNDVVDRGGRLRAIVRAGSGLDGIDVEHARLRGIDVVSTGGSNARSVAEHVVALALAAAKGIVHWDQLARTGGYARRDEDPVDELYGKRWGVIGFGRIGREVAQIVGDGLGMAVSAYVHRRLAVAPGAVDVHYELGELLAECDVVSIHVPLTEATRGMIGTEEIATLKRSVVLVNASRGPVIDSSALLTALQTGAIRAAALDVWDGPFPDPPHPLYAAPHLVLSPHRAGRTREADRAAGRIVVDEVRKALSSPQGRLA